MASFDLSGAVQQARTGVIPPDWKRFPLLSRAIWSNLLGSLILGIFCVGVAIYLFVSRSAYVPTFLPDSFFSPTGILITSIIESLLFLAIGIWLLVLGIRWVPRIGDSDGYFFLVTPAGFAEVKGEKVVGLPFTDVLKLRQKNGYFGPELLIQRRTGGTLTLAIGRSYGPARQISATLLEGVAALYRAQQ